MSDFKDQMIEAYERGECSYEGSYDYVRESLADAADLARKREKENAADSVTQNFGLPSSDTERKNDA